MTIAAVPQASTPVWFRECLAEFLASWRQPTTAAIVRAYWRTLADLPEADVVAAGLALRRTGGEFPPSAAVWYATAQQRQRERLVRDAVHVERIWRTECDACDDTGWVPHTCTASARCGRSICARASDDHEHSYVSACPCRPMNSTYQRNLQRSRSRHSDPGERAQGDRKSSGWTKASQAR